MASSVVSSVAGFLRHIELGVVVPSSSIVFLFVVSPPIVSPPIVASSVVSSVAGLRHIELGANALIDHLVIFDPEQSRVGFAAADCAGKTARRAGSGSGRSRPRYSVHVDADGAAAADGARRAWVSRDGGWGGGGAGRIDGGVVALAAFAVTMVAVMVAVIRAGRRERRPTERRRLLDEAEMAPHARYATNQQ